MSGQHSDMIVEARAARPAAPSSSPAASRLQRRLAAGFWFGLVPLLATLATMRWLVPARSQIGAAWGWLAELGARYSLPMAIGLFLLFTGLARFWRDRLPWGRQLLAQASAPRPPRTPPQRITSIAVVMLAALAALTLRSKAGQLCEVSGASMVPTLLPGDTMVVSKLGRRSLRRADIVAFRTRDEQRRTRDARTQAPVEDWLVKRVIGLPGDRIEMRAGIPRINGWEVPHCDAGTYVRYAANGTLVGRLLVEFLEDQVFLSVHVPGTKSFAGYDVKRGEVFVVGDDRSNSDDSRAWNDGRGAGVPLTSIEGRPWRVIGSDVDGRVDLGRLFQRPGLQLHMPGMDLRALKSGLRRCLAERPKDTWPPAPVASSSNPGEAGGV